MLIRAFVGVYWGARQDSLECCAKRLKAHFISLSHASDKLSQWMNLGRSSKRNYINIGLDDEIVALLKRGENKGEFDKKAIPELGYRVALWNGRENSFSAQTMVKCGLQAKVAGLSNAASVSISFDEWRSGDFDSERTMEELVSIWDAESGIVRFTMNNSSESDEYIDLDYINYVKDGFKKPKVSGDWEKVKGGWLAKTSIKF